MITPTQLRSDIYNILDQVIATNIPVIVEREGERLSITKIPNKKKPGKLDNLVKRDLLAPGVTDDDIIYHNAAVWDEEPEIDQN